MSLSRSAYDRVPVFLAALSAVLLPVAAAQAQTPPISFVQSTYAVPQTPQTTVPVRYTGAQTAGNLNVVAIGWNDATSQVLAVTDTVGNVYVPALPPTVQPGTQSHVIYYAANIGSAAANTNTVTVTFNAAVDYPDVRIAEYRGISPTTPVDVTKGAVGTSATSNSGAVTTTSASALLVGANYVQTSTRGPGSGYTQRLITSPNGSILEDRVVTAAGSYSATAPTNGGGWVMQLVVFRGAGGGGDTQAPTAPTLLTATATSSTMINLAWTASTDNVGVTGYRVERCQGAGCSTFALVGTPAGPSFGDSGLTAGTSYSYRVRATDAATNLSGYSNTASATTSTAPDTQAPTAPTALTATASSSTTITLTWTASTDNVGVTGYRVERCQGAGCSTFAQVGTPAGLSFGDSGLTAGTSYSYRVRATDAATNLSGYSNTASATTSTAPDTQAPTAPIGLTATASSSTTITLAWTASTDNVGVTGYRVERCQGAGCSTFTQVGTPTGPSFGDTGLTAGTSYSYQVRATDAATNLSGYSNTASATTLAATDTQAPTAPTGLMATASSNSTITLAWTASTDNVGVTGYRVERCQGAGCGNFTQVGTSTGRSFGDSGLTASTSYSYQVRATDAATNLSGYSNIASATTLAGGPPPIAFVQSTYAVPQTPQATVPARYTGAQTAGNLNVVAIGWNNATSQVLTVTDTVGNVYVPALAATVQPGIQSHVIYYAANIGAAAANTNTVTVTFSAAVDYPDVRIVEYQGINPLAPVDVTKGAFGTSATSNSGAVTTTSASALLVGANYVQSSTTGPGSGYTQRLITSPNGSILEDRVVTAVGSYSATAPTNGSGWVMQLVAFRGAGGVGGDTQAPMAPAGLMAMVSSSTAINLMWTASTDNVAVTGYRVERCQGAGCSSFTQVGTPTAPSFGDSGLTASTSYSYRVRAIDAASNLSGYSNTASGTTLAATDTQPPTAPTGLTATASSNSTIALAWTASTDNVGVTSYRVERCQGAGCGNFTQVGTSTGPSFGDSALIAGTSYSYQVRATDAATNLSGYSNTASATTLTGGPPPIAFVQSNYAVPQAPQVTVPLRYTGAQAAGNLNVVAIGWNDASSQVLTVTDTVGNVYAPALAATVQPGIQSHVIYYAAGIGSAAANTNTVTVRFNAPVEYPDVRIAEYQGINPVTPVDVTSGAFGTGTTSNSGAVTTTSATALLVGANYVQTSTVGPGSG